MHPKQIENLLNLTPEQRVEFFVRYCADFEKVWGLSVGQDNWVIFKDSDGDEIFPVWPHESLAELCAFHEHKEMGATPQEMTVYSFVEDCLSNPDLDGVYFGVFYDDKREGLVMESKVLKSALEEELSEYE